MAKEVQYEVWCSQCNVSFPVGTRRCIHCGAPTGPRPEGVRHTGMRDAALDPVSLGQYDEEVEQEAEASRGGLFRILSNVVWVLIFLGFWLVRACSEGGAVAPR